MPKYKEATFRKIRKTKSLETEIINGGISQREAWGWSEKRQGVCQHNHKKHKAGRNQDYQEHIRFIQS